jgi:hypothetical protein
MFLLLLLLQVVFVVFSQPAAPVQTQSFATLSSSHSGGGPVPPPWSLAGRTARYCADPPFGPHDESAAPSLGYELVHATVLVRHGDRSNIGRFPGTAREVFECGEPTASAVARYARELSLFRSSSDCLLAGGSGPLCEGITGGELGESSDSARFSWGLQKEAGSACSVGGELSTVGWRQLRGVGQTLGLVYRDLILAGGYATTPLQVISTDTGRTVLSAASLFGGVLEALIPGWPESRAGNNNSSSSSSSSGSSSGSGSSEGQAPPLASASVTEAGEAAPLREPPTVARPAGQGVAPPPTRSLSALQAHWLASGLAANPLPGLTLPLALHVLPREQDPMLWPKKAHVCPAAAVAQGQQEEAIFQHQVLPEGVAGRVAALTGVGEDSLPTTEECADDLLTRACHRLPLPCWNSSQGLACLPPGDAAAILQRCDEGYAHRFTNAVTDVLTYPLLSQLLHTLQRAAARQQAEASARQGSGSGGGAAAEAAAAALPDGGTVPRLALRSVHDTVLAPLLAVLRATEQPYAWPTYASRVALELWAPPASASSSASQYLVTVLYNGVDVTGRLECAAEWAGGAAGGAAGGGAARAACTLQGLQAQVARLIEPHASWEAACVTDQAVPPAEVHPPNGKKRKAQAHASTSDVGPGGA